MGRFINADAYASTGQGVLGNNMFTYCLNNPVMHSDSTGEWTWIGATIGGVTNAITCIMGGGTAGEVVWETFVGFCSGGCTSVVGALVWTAVECIDAACNTDASEPTYLSLLLNIFSAQITGDNLNVLLKGVLSNTTINLFDWTFGMGADLVTAGIDVLINLAYAENSTIVTAAPSKTDNTTNNTTTTNPAPNRTRQNFSNNFNSRAALNIESNTLRIQ